MCLIKGSHVALALWGTGRKLKCLTGSSHAPNHASMPSVTCVFLSLRLIYIHLNAALLFCFSLFFSVILETSSGM